SINFDHVFVQLCLREALSCPVCLGLFRDPVMVSGCGHNLCRDCVAKCWGRLEGSLRCPQCLEPLPLQRLLQPNALLGSLAQRVRGQGGTLPDSKIACILIFKTHAISSKLS
uniref:RING-type domain-containing protein n=1 Tax=Varanus komodoensis TaxID=61221 RepID=A0A8D2LIB1_VARKO